MAVSVLIFGFNYSCTEDLNYKTVLGSYRPHSPNLFNKYLSLPTVYLFCRLQSFAVGFFSVLRCLIWDRLED